jgi:hypothetical protein
MGIEVNKQLSKVPKRSVIDNGFLNFIYEAIASNDQYPCVTNYDVGFNDKLCDAFIENDLTYTLENADYDITLIHSPFDDLVSIMNLPDCDSNPDHLKCTMVIGDHQLAYPLFLGHLATHFTTVGDYQNQEEKMIEESLPPNDINTSFWCVIVSIFC